MKQIAVIVTLASTVLLVGATLAGIALAASPYATALGNVGYDVSWPQCSRALPVNHAFAIVGVNHGKANSTNPCFKTELAWALRPHGVRSSRVDLYVNTGDPGNLGVRAWPKNNIDPVTGVRVSNPFGRCSGGDHPACAWQYGWNMAERDARWRGVTNPRAYTWWLDVETGNSWESNRQNNRAVLGGMVALFYSLGASAGVYSTRYQWSVIAGPISSFSRLYTVPDWIAGADNRTSARAYCRSRPLTTGGMVWMTQWYTSRSIIDGDVVC